MSLQIYIFVQKLLIYQFYPPMLEIKQGATAAHFFSLMALGFLYFTKHDQTKNCAVFTAVMFSLAIFIPPTGMIKPDDAPEYAKNSMSYVPRKDGSAGPFGDADAKVADTKASNTKRKGKKNK